jgi:hypothetical protein
MLYKALLVWIGILFLAIANGWLRERLLIPAFGSPAALVLSGALLSLLILVTAYAVVPWLGPRVSTQCLYVGLIWLGLTLVFEFTFGRSVQHKSWPELLQAYTFKGGNIWPVVLTIIVLAPFIAAKLRGIV